MSEDDLFSVGFDLPRTNFYEYSDEEAEKNWREGFETTRIVHAEPVLYREHLDAPWLDKVAFQLSRSKSIVWTKNFGQGGGYYSYTVLKQSDFPRIFDYVTKRYRRNILDARLYLLGSELASLKSLSLTIKLDMVAEQEHYLAMIHFGAIRKHIFQKGESDLSLFRVQNGDIFILPPPTLKEKCTLSIEQEPDICAQKTYICAFVLSGGELLH